MCFVSCCRFWLISYLCFYCVYIFFFFFFFFSSRRRHTRCGRDWSSDVCSSDLRQQREQHEAQLEAQRRPRDVALKAPPLRASGAATALPSAQPAPAEAERQPSRPGRRHRSEERRVGKECTSRRVPSASKKKSVS